MEHSEAVFDGTRAEEERGFGLLSFSDDGQLAVDDDGGEDQEAVVAVADYTMVGKKGFFLHNL